MGKLMLWSRSHPAVVILVTLVASIFFAYHAVNIRIDSSTEGMQIKGDPNREIYDRTIAMFGSDNTAVIFIKDDALFTPEKLTAIEDVFYNLEDLTGVTRIDGLFNQTNFKGEDGFLNTNPFLDWVPEDPAELQQIKADALRSPLLRRSLIGLDGNSMAIVLTIDAEAGGQDFLVEFAGRVEHEIEPLRKTVDQVFQVGTPSLRKYLKENIQRDQRGLGPMYPVVMLALLIVGIRTFNGAILPMITGGLTILWTAGFMALADVPFNFLTSVIPSLILIIGATEDMHMLSEYLHALDEGHNRDAAIEIMAQQTGMAIFLTGITTFLGFASIMINDITALKHFGLVASFALLVNPVLTACLVPVYLRFFGERQAHPRFSNSRFQVLGQRILDLVLRRGLWIAAIISVIVVVMVWGMFYLRLDSNTLGYFKPEAPIRVHNDILQKEMAGAQIFYVVLDGKQEDAFRKSDALQTLERVQQGIEASGLVDLTLSPANHIALIHREMADGDPAAYRVPDRDDLIAQYYLFFTRADLERYLSADGRFAAIHVRHNFQSSKDLKRALASLNAEIENHIPDTMSYHISDETLLYDAASATMSKGQVYSLSLILGVIFVLMSILFVRIKAGFLAMVPNILPIVMLFGIMGIMKIPLNPGTALIAACAIGIAVDDTIHLFVRYNREMKRLNDERAALIETVQGEIRPVTITTLSVACGFAILGFSNFIPTIHFGLLGAWVMIIALIADLLVTPILLARTKLITLWDILELRLTEKVIKHSPLFLDMTPWQIKKVVLLGHLEEFTQGERIIRQGAIERSMYMLLEGSAEARLVAPSGEAHSVSQFSEGEVFGEIALVNEVARSADVLATSDARVLVLDWEALQRIGKIFPNISTRFFLNISRILGTRLVDTNEALLKIKQRS